MWRFPGREPDLLVFDLDPGLPATVVDCCRVAEELRPLLEDEGLRPLPKTSGGKGLQLYAAISGLTAEQASARAKALAERMEERAPRPGGVPDDQVAARGQGAHRLEPEQRLQDHHRPLLAARQDPPHRVDPGHAGTKWPPAGRPTTFSSPRPTSSPAWTPTATFSPPCSPYCRLRHYRRVVANITMYDTIYNNQFPAGAQAYAAYVDGGLGNQPNYAYIVNTFPKAEHLSIALSSSNNADALDVEAGAATPGEIPAWCTRQRQRGIQRPCIYANASTMQGSVLPELSAAKIARSTVRLWSAHYGLGEHICGPSSCGALSTEADGTQWTSSALGLVLDQSELQANFFTISPTTAVSRRRNCNQASSPPARMR